MGYYTRSCKININRIKKKVLINHYFQDQVIAKHPPEYYINGLQTYIRGANLVEKASTLVMKFLYFINHFYLLLEKKTTD